MNRTSVKHVLSFVLIGVVLSLGQRAAHGQTPTTTFSVVYNFGSQVNDPIEPFYSGIIAQGQDGSMYSGVETGGGSYYGSLYKITVPSVLTVPYAFSDSDGASPVGGLTLGTDGNFYGTAYGGGYYGYGMIFKWSSTAGLTTLYTFTDGTDGSEPTAPPIEGTDGNFYGTTCPQGAYATGYGSIYKITPLGTFTPLYDFDSTHGYCPLGPLVQGTDGNFYGTTFFGGTNCISGVSCGVVFKITPAGTLTVLHNFCAQISGSFCTDGEGPVGPLVQGSDGNFYGTPRPVAQTISGSCLKLLPQAS